MMQLNTYLTKMTLPNPPLPLDKKICRKFRDLGVETLWEALAYVWQLPYARPTDRGNYLQILEEKQGTCSGKHALIAALALEIDIPLKLYIGFFFLTPQNRPAIADLLKTYQLEAIPEAHTYLKYGNTTLDITSPHAQTFTFDVPLEEEVEILPDQIGTYKVSKHQDFIRKWAGDPLFETVWKAREEWIRSLT